MFTWIKAQFFRLNVDFQIIQDVWHYHLHVYPRYENDNLYLRKGEYTEPDDRPLYAEKLRLWIKENT